MAQISMETALDECRVKLGELVYENVLLRAHVKALEAAAQQAAEAPAPQEAEAPAQAPVTLRDHRSPWAGPSGGE